MGFAHRPVPSIQRHRGGSQEIFGEYAERLLPTLGRAPAAWVHHPDAGPVILGSLVCSTKLLLRFDKRPRLDSSQTLTGMASPRLGPHRSGQCHYMT